MHLYSGYIESPIGYWIIQSNDHAVTSISHSNSKPDNCDDKHPVIRKAQRQLNQYFKKQRQTFSLPLDLEPHSHFYKEVWAALSMVPFGHTCSYSDLAIAVHNPKAVRAVGMANGRNPFPIVIPCHRVLGKDKSLTGYASGLVVKKWLLEHEGAMAFQASLF